MYKKDIFKNAQENFDNSRINPSLSSTKEYDDLLSFIKNTKEGLIQIDVYSVFQIFSIFFLLFISFLLIFIYGSLISLVPECFWTLLNNTEKYNNTKICLFVKNILPGENSFFLFIQNQLFFALIFIFVVLWLGLFVLPFISSKMLEIDVINQKLSLKNFWGKTIKSFSFYELKNFYNINIKEIRLMKLILVETILEEIIILNLLKIISKPSLKIKHILKFPKYPIEIKIIHKGNNKVLAKYIAIGSIYPPEFLEYIINKTE